MFNWFHDFENGQPRFTSDGTPHSMPIEEVDALSLALAAKDNEEEEYKDSTLGPRVVAPGGGNAPAPAPVQVPGYVPQRHGAARPPLHVQQRVITNNPFQQVHQVQKYKRAGLANNRVNQQQQAPPINFIDTSLVHPAGLPTLAPQPKIPRALPPPAPKPKPKRKLTPGTALPPTTRPQAPIINAAPEPEPYVDFNQRPPLTVEQQAAELLMRVKAGDTTHTPEAAVVEIVEKKKQTFLQSRDQWIHNLKQWVDDLIRSKGSSGLASHFVRGTVRLLSSDEKNSVSSSVIVFADVLLDHPSHDNSQLKDQIDPEFLKQDGYCGIALKVFLTPLVESFDNSLLFEMLEYKSLYSQLVRAKHCPHIINYITSFSTTVGQLNLGTDANESKQNQTAIIDQLSKRRNKRVTLSDRVDVLLTDKSFQPYPTDATDAKKAKKLGDFLVDLNASALATAADPKAVVKAQEAELIQMIWQMIWTLENFGNVYARHNDLHHDNIFIEEMYGHPYEFFYQDPENPAEALLIRTKWFTRIFDFDRGSIIDGGVDRNEFPDRLSSNAANRISSRYDIHGFLMGFLQQQWTRYDGNQDGRVMKAKPLNDYPNVVKWIKGMIPLQVLNYYFPATPGALCPEALKYPQLSLDQPTEKLLSDYKLQLSTPRDYRRSFLKHFAGYFRTVPMSTVDTFNNPYVFRMKEQRKSFETRSPIRPGWFAPGDPTNLGRHLDDFDFELYHKQLEGQVGILLDPAMKERVIKAKHPGILNVDSAKQAEIELILDININKYYPELIKTWQRELEVLFQMKVYDVEKARDTLFMAYLQNCFPGISEPLELLTKAGTDYSHDTRVAIVKAIWIISAPQFYTYPADFRRRLVLQMGQLAYRAYYDVYKRLGDGTLKPRLDQVTLPVLNRWID